MCDPETMSVGTNNDYCYPELSALGECVKDNPDAFGEDATQRQQDVPSQLQMLSS
jgi:hypothetical protein